VKEEAGMAILKDMQKLAVSREKKTILVTSLMTGKKHARLVIKAEKL
jgi:hypothetical protein